MGDVAGMALRQPLTESVFLSVIQKYSDAPVSAVSLRQYYRDAYPVIKGLVQLYRSELSAGNQLIQPYESEKQAAVRLQQPYANTHQSDAVLTQPYSGEDGAVLNLNQPYGILDSVAGLVVKQLYNLNDTDTAAINLLQRYHLLDDSTIEPLVFWVTIGGGLHQPIGIDLTWSEDMVTYEITIQLASKQAFDTVGYYDNVVFHWQGVNYHGFVTNKDSGKSISGKQYQETYTVQVESYASMLVEPYAKRLTMDFPNTMLAEDIIAAIVNEIYPMPIVWDAPPLIILGGTFNLEDEEPMSAIRRLIGMDTFDGIFQPMPDKSILIRKRIPVSPSLWDITKPDRILNDDGMVFSDNDVDDEQQYYNYISVGHLSSEGKTLEDDDVSATEKIVRCYCHPWDDDVVLQTSGGPDVQIIPMGVDTREEEEIVEIVDGGGNVRYPVDEVLNYTYQEDDLGIVSAQGQIITTLQKDNSVVKLKYKVKFHAWRVTNPTMDEIQVFIKAD